MATISDEELRALIDNSKAMATKIEELSKLITPDGTGTMRLLKRVTERHVTLRTIDGKVVVGYRNKGTQDQPLFIYTKPDPKDPTQKLEFVDIILDGTKPENAITLPFGEFRKQAGKVIAKVTSIDEKEWEINQGITKKREVDGYSNVELDFDIPMDVVGKTRFFNVELTNGEKVRLHESYVNIA